MSVCPEHQVERALYAGVVRCVEHFSASKARYDASAKGLAANRLAHARYDVTPKGRMAEARRNDRRAIKAIRARRAAAPALIRELLSQLTSPTEDPSNG